MLPLIPTGLSGLTNVIHLFILAIPMECELTVKTNRRHAMTIHAVIY